MKTIHKLSDVLISQIAAGEVIERPCYVIKELIDNAIDAKATDIRITVEDFGLKKIAVLDNGDGMSEDDLLESYKLHTTSKIGEDQLFYCNQRGINTEKAIALIVNGFGKEVLNKLPMEFAVEAQKLLEISLEGSVG